MTENLNIPEKYPPEDFNSEEMKPTMIKREEISKEKDEKLSKIHERIEAGYEVISEKDEEKAVLVISRTCSGKSTVVNYLIRPQEMKAKNNALPGLKYIYHILY